MLVDTSLRVGRRGEQTAWLGVVVALLSPDEETASHRIEINQDTWQFKRLITNIPFNNKTLASLYFYSAHIMNDILVYSHVRSGTHLLEKYLAINFYNSRDLSIRPVKWGHWSNRKMKWTGDKYGQLFGSHNFPDKVSKKLENQPAVYIYRDGRAVCTSVWRTPNFLHKDWYPIDFSSFLTRHLDWYGSPSMEAAPKINIIEHWEKHVTAWLKYENENLLLVRFEELVDEPDKVMKCIATRFNLPLESVQTVDEPVGLLPNNGTNDTWKELFSKEDLDTFYKFAPELKKLYSVG